MEKLDWFEWDFTPQNLEFSITQRGILPSYIDKVKLYRDSDLKILAHGQGTINPYEFFANPFNLSENKQLKAGKIIPSSEDTMGKNEYGETVRLTIEPNFSEQFSNAATKNIFIDATVYEAEVILSDTLLVTTQLEWIVNLSIEPYLFPPRQNRDIVKQNLSKDYYSTNRNHFICECTVEGKKWSLSVGEVSKEITSAKFLPGYIKFFDIDNCLPSEDTKQMILAALSFTLGRQLVSVGSTSLSKDAKRVRYTLKTVSLLGEEASYRQPSFPPVKLDLTDKTHFLDENKMSFVLNAVLEKMKDLNLEHSLFLVWLAQASPLSVKAIVEDLLSRPHLTPEENTLLELLVRLIEDFENQHYQLNVSTPRSRILHLLKAQDLEIGDLVPIFGSSELVSQVINGEMEVTQEQAEMLGNLFHVDASLFIE
jgi:HTH-type transcriptional regulator/antitoxin HigA